MTSDDENTKEEEEATAALAGRDRQGAEQTEEGLSATQTDDAGTICMICMEEWTIGGEHRLCCLKCGHLFGRGCIERWIKERGVNSKCPTCNKPSKRADLRDLWCKSIKAADNTELSQLQELLENERKLRKSDSAVIFHQTLKLDLLHDELNKLKKCLYERDTKILKLENIIDRYNKLRANSITNRTLSEHNQDSNQDPNSTRHLLPDLECQEVDIDIDCEVVPQELKGQFHLGEKVESSSTGGCRAFSLCSTSSVLLVAQPAPPEHRNIFAPFGLRRYSTLDTNIKEFIPLHTKPINSIQLKPYGDLILTAGQDKKVRLTSTSNNTCVQSYNCDHDPTCVAWSTHRDQQFYVGSGNCYVSLYDIRNTSEYIYQTNQRIAKTRIISLTAMNSQHVKGIIVNDLKNAQLLEVSEDSSYELESIDRSKEHLSNHNLPFEGLMGTVDYNKRLNLTLVSTRKTAMNKSCCHNLIQIENIQNDEQGNQHIHIKPMRTFLGGPTNDQPLLSQSRILKHPTLDESVLIGAADEASGGVKLWDSSDNTVYQTIKTDRFVRDMIVYSPDNSNQHFLYLLSEQGIYIYRWDYA